MLAEIRQKDKPAYTKARLAAAPATYCLVLQMEYTRMLTETRPNSQPVTFSTIAAYQTRIASMRIIQMSQAIGVNTRQQQSNWRGWFLRDM